MVQQRIWLFNLEDLLFVSVVNHSKDKTEIVQLQKCKNKADLDLFIYF